jgi:hypothetical protein
MRRLEGERRDMSGRHQAPPKKGLLILAVEDEDSDQSILDRLEQQFHFRVTRLFGRAHLSPAFSPHAQQIKPLIQPQKQGFSALVSGEQPLNHLQTVDSVFRCEARKCFGIHGMAV